MVRWIKISPLALKIAYLDILFSKPLFVIRVEVVRPMRPEGLAVILHRHRIEASDTIHPCQVTLEFGCYAGAVRGFHVPDGDIGVVRVLEQLDSDQLKFVV